MSEPTTGRRPDQRLPFNGTLRRAIITGLVGLVFAALTYLFRDVMTRLAWLESEAYRVGKIAAGRGERIEKLESHVERVEREMIDLRMNAGGGRRR